jgi:virginiamycin B lyase
MQRQSKSHFGDLGSQPEKRWLSSTLVGLAVVLSGCVSGGSVCEPEVEGFRLEVAESEGINVEYYVFGASRSSVHDPAIGPDGRVWYVDTWRNCVGTLDPKTGAITEYSTHRDEAGPHGIDVAGDGTVWYAATAIGSIGRFRPDDGARQSYDIFEGPVDPHTILVSGGRVWFTAPRANVYGYLDPASGGIESFQGPTPGSHPYGLAAAPDGSIWITFGGTSHIGRMSPETHELTLFPLAKTSRAHRISVAWDGGIWYTDRMGHQVGRLDPATGSVQHHKASSDRAFPLSIATDSKGDVWYYEEGTARLVRLRPQCSSESAITLDLPGVIVRHMVPDPSTDAIWIALGEVPGVARISSIDESPCPDGRFSRPENRKEPSGAGA